MKPSDAWRIWRDTVYETTESEHSYQVYSPPPWHFRPKWKSRPTDNRWDIWVIPDGLQTPRNPLKNVNNLTDINSLYKRNKKTAVKRSCQEAIDSSIVPTEQDIYEMSSELSKKPDPIDWTKCPEIKKARNQFHFKAPTAREIEKMFKHCNKRSSPGFDGISHTELMDFVSNAPVLEELFKVITLLGVTPTIWKASNTTLIPKSGNLSQASNWRPVALLNASYKVFTACYTDQLMKWMSDEEVMHRNQKSLALYEGCVVHNFALSMVTEQYKRHGYITHTAFLDIDNAFPSLPVEAILGILDRHDSSDLSRNLIWIVKPRCALNAWKLAHFKVNSWLNNVLIGPIAPVNYLLYPLK